VLAVNAVNRRKPLVAHVGVHKDVHSGSAATIPARSILDCIVRSGDRPRFGTRSVRTPILRAGAVLIGVGPAQRQSEAILAEIQSATSSPTSSDRRKGPANPNMLKPIQKAPKVHHPASCRPLACAPGYEPLKRLRPMPPVSVRHTKGAQRLATDLFCRELRKSGLIGVQSHRHFR
jgi:hypothetical protein